MIEASAEKVAAMLEEARRQHPEESDGQHRKRVAYRLNALRKKDKIEVLHDRIAKMESQDWRWWLIIGMFALFLILFGVSQAHCQIAPNVNIQRIAGTNIAAGIYDSGNTAFKVNCVVGCSATAGFSDNSTFTVGTTTINVIGGYYTSGAAPTLTTGNAGRARIDASSFLMVNCASGCSGGATTPADTFTNPTTAGLSMVFPGVWNGTTWDRLYGDKTNGAFVNIKNSVSLAVTGTFWQATQPVSATSLPLPTGAAADSSLTTLDTDLKSNITLHAGTNLLGKVGIDQTTPGTTNAVQETNLPSTVDTNSGNKSASTLRTVIATDQPNLTTPLNETPQSANGLPLGTNQNPIYVASLAPLVLPTTKSQLVGALGQQLGTPQNPLNVQIPVSDPCAGGNKRNVPISVTANTQLVVAPPTGTVHICHLFLLSTSAETYSLVGGTGSTCGTGVEAIIGSTTAANGPSYAANGGQTDGSGMGTIAASNVPGNNVCILISGSTLIAGNLVWAY